MLPPGRHRQGYRLPHPRGNLPLTRWLARWLGRWLRCQLLDGFRLAVGGDLWCRPRRGMRSWFRGQLRCGLHGHDVRRWHRISSATKVRCPVPAVYSSLAIGPGDADHCEVAVNSLPLKSSPFWEGTHRPSGSRTTTLSGPNWLTIGMESEAKASAE